LLLLLPNRFGPWFTEPVVAGLKEDGTPFLSGMDLIGAPVFAHDFVVSGTCTSNLHGMCESLYRPDMVSGSPTRRLLTRLTVRLTVFLLDAVSRRAV
jgi:20S proteasome alpha/beta subunit